MKRRYLDPMVRGDFDSKMVFIGGPRQVGKTTLASIVGDSFDRVVYLNWDNRQHKRQILDGSWSADAQLVVLDEVHKYAKWKSLVKGYWDTRREGMRVVVTGSSKLNTFRRGGDSLLGRYHYYCLHPFSLSEVNEAAGACGDIGDRPTVTVPERPANGLDDLLAYGGFPEPFLAASTRTLRRWQQQRFERVFREDIRDGETVRALSQVEVLGSLLPDRVGAPLSYASLARDVDASPKTVQAWLELLCRNYYVFRVPPYSRKLHRALKKESKYYLWDWSETPDNGARFENVVAAHLLKYCHFLHDAFGHEVELHYLRDLDKREVDFLVTWHKKPWIVVECKTKAGGSLDSVAYFADRLGVGERYVVTRESAVDHLDRHTAVRSISADRFLAAFV